MESSSDEKIRLTKLFHENPKRDPITGNRVIKNKKPYNELVKLYGDPDKSVKSDKSIKPTKPVKKIKSNVKVEETSILDVLIPLIHTGDMLALYKLSETNNYYKKELSKEENIKTLLHVTKLNKYYKVDDIGNFNDLYLKYKNLHAKKVIYNYIKESFTKEDFKRATEINNKDLIGKIKTYKEFMKHQWNTLLHEIDERKQIKFLTYITEVGEGFGFIDKEYMLPMFNDGL